MCALQLFLNFLAPGHVARTFCVAPGEGEERLPALRRMPGSGCCVQAGRRAAAASGVSVQLLQARRGVRTVIVASMAEVVGPNNPRGALESGGQKNHRGKRSGREGGRGMVTKVAASRHHLAQCAAAASAVWVY